MSRHLRRLAERSTGAMASPALFPTVRPRDAEAALMPEEGIADAAPEPASRPTPLVPRLSMDGAPDTNTADVTPPDQGLAAPPPRPAPSNVTGEASRDQEVPAPTRVDRAPMDPSESLRTTLQPPLAHERLHDAVRRRDVGDGELAMRQGMGDKPAGKQSEEAPLQQPRRTTLEMMDIHRAATAPTPSLPGEPQAPIVPAERPEFPAPAAPPASDNAAPRGTKPVDSTSPPPQVERAVAPSPRYSADAHKPAPPQQQHKQTSAPLEPPRRAAPPPRQPQEAPPTVSIGRIDIDITSDTKAPAPQPQRRASPRAQPPARSSRKGKGFGFRQM